MVSIKGSSTIPNWDIWYCPWKSIKPQISNGLITDLWVDEPLEWTLYKTGEPNLNFTWYNSTPDLLSKEGKVTWSFLGNKTDNESLERLKDYPGLWLISNGVQNLIIGLKGQVIPIIKPLWISGVIWQMELNGDISEIHSDYLRWNLPTTYENCNKSLKWETLWITNKQDYKIIWNEDGTLINDIWINSDLPFGWIKLIPNSIEANSDYQNNIWKHNIKVLWNVADGTLSNSKDLWNDDWIYILGNRSGQFLFLDKSRHKISWEWSKTGNNILWEINEESNRLQWVNPDWGIYSTIPEALSSNCCSAFCSTPTTSDILWIDLFGCKIKELNCI